MMGRPFEYVMLAVVAPIGTAYAPGVGHRYEFVGGDFAVARDWVGRTC